MAEDSPAAAEEIAALTCNETEALLQVKYNITEDEWDNSRPQFPSFNQRAFLRIRGNEVVEYENFADVKNYEVCLPRDECSGVVVGGLPTDAYELSFDGKAVDIGNEFFFDGTNPVTSTEVGTDCPFTKPPICKDTEALLEIQYWGGSFDYNLYHFRVEDKDGGTILSDDACYTFLIGGEYQMPAYIHPLPSYSLIFDGELVRSSESWLFDSVQFGGTCEPLCNQDDESLIEFFMYDRKSKDLPGMEYEYKWDLSITNPSSSETVSSGVVPMAFDISPLAHKIICAPKGSCASFYIAAPNVTREVVRLVPAENTTNTDDIVWVNVTRNERVPLAPVYSLTMDNVNYRKVLWRNSESYRGSDNQTTNMGTCSVDLCDVQTQDLFDLRLLTSATHEWPSIGRGMNWNFGYTEVKADDQGLADWDSKYLLRYSYQNDGAYELNSSYGAIECVPKDGCELSFNMTQGSPVDSYTVMKNGLQLDPSEVGPDVLMTPFGQNCFPASNSNCNSLSGGAIAGIAVACVVSWLGLI